LTDDVRQDTLMDEWVDRRHCTGQDTDGRSMSKARHTLLVSMARALGCHFWHLGCHFWHTCSRPVDTDRGHG